MKTVKPKLYIDIDGVMLGKQSPDEYEICLAGGARDFLAYALRHFDCFWLTSRAHQGDARPALEALKPYADKMSMELAKFVKPTAWTTLKTEAIDLTGDFYWLDDLPLEIEKETLKKYGRLDRWIRVDTRANYMDLVSIMHRLAKYVPKI